MSRKGKEEIVFTQVGFKTFCVQPIPMPRLHRHEEIEFNFVERGELTYLHHGEFANVPAQKMTVFWAAFPHRLIEVRAGTILHVVNVPLRWFLQAQLPERFTQSILRGDMIAETVVDQSRLDLGLLNHWHTDLETDQPERRSIVELEVEARLRRLALTGKPVVAARLAKVKAKKVGRGLIDSTQIGKAVEMALFIAENYTQPLRAKDIADVVHLHPNYATNVFRGMFGMRLRDYLTRQRVAHAQRLVMTTDMKFLDIALASGFGSASRFYAAFQRVCGKAPRHYRETHRH